MKPKKSTGGNYGLQYIYESTATFNGEPVPIRLGLVG